MTEEADWSAATARQLNSTLPFDTHKAILFVREVGEGTSSDQKDSGSDLEGSSERGFLSGHEARQFYEDVLSMPEQSSGSSEGNTVKRRKRKTRRRTQRLSETNPVPSEHSSISASQAFRCAQDGDLNGVKSALTSGSCDVNSVDQFHWTLLMCAAHAGHTHIIEHLLSLGAEWRDHVDKRGRSAADLARLAGHLSIACLIEASDDIFTQSQRPRKVARRQRRESAPDIPSNSSRSSRQRTTYYCEECNQTITESIGEQHTTSTLHQFSCQHRPKVHGYGIPQSNKGYQMMLRGGWDPDSGLGSNQEGQRYPVKTILKRDRLGFGLAPQEMSQNKARVTHFSAFDESAVKWPSERHKVDGKPSVTKKKDIVKAAHKERQWEARMRRYMNAEHGYGKFC